MGFEVGSKVKVRDNYTVQIGGDVFQGGEVLPVTVKNMPELASQEWKLELAVVSRKKDKKDEDEKEDKPKKKQVKSETNRAVISPRDTHRARIDTKME
jgi:hypothetical protein